MSEQSLSKGFLWATSVADPGGDIPIAVVIEKVEGLNEEILVLEAAIEGLKLAFLGQEQATERLRHERSFLLGLVAGVCARIGEEAPIWVQDEINLMYQPAFVAKSTLDGFPLENEPENSVAIDPVTHKPGPIVPASGEEGLSVVDVADKAAVEAAIQKEASIRGLWDDEDAQARSNRHGEGEEFTS